MALDKESIFREYDRLKGVSAMYQALSKFVLEQSDLHNEKARLLLERHKETPLSDEELNIASLSTYTCIAYTDYFRTITKELIHIGEKLEKIDKEFQAYQETSNTINL